MFFHLNSHDFLKALRVLYEDTVHSHQYREKETVLPHSHRT